MNIKKILLLVGLLAGILSVSALAADGGVCGATVTDASKFTLTKVGKEQLYLECKNPVEGEQYLVLVMSGEGGEMPTIPTESNIVYIDQNENGGFTIYPSTMSDGTCYVFLSSTSNTLDNIGSFRCYSSCKLGDVDGENGLNAYDASLILQYLVNKYQFVGNGELAADVDGENGIASYDASLILQHLVNKYEIPGWEE